MLEPLVLVGALAALVTRPQQLPDAAALLDQREESLGTREARAKVAGLVATGRLEIAGTAVVARFEERHLVGPPERVLFTQHMEGWGATSQGTDGVVSWTTDPGFGVAIKEGPEQMPVRRMWAILRSAPWRTLYASARTLGVVERDGRALVELELAPRAGRPERWYLDHATHELVRVAVVYPGPTGGNLPMEWVLEDWRAVEGVRYPHRRIQEVRGGSPATSVEGGADVMRLVYQCESIRPATLTPAELAPPADVLAALADPTKRAPEPAADATRCALETRAPQPVASVRLVIDASAVSATLATTLTEVMAALTEQGAEMSGPPFSRYHAIDEARGTIDLEAGIPVKAAIRASGRVQPSALPGGRAAMTWHIGSYHQLQESYDRLEAWIAGEKLAKRGGFFEIYWTDPGLEPDPSSWRTQIFWPVE
jgi:effector-binding domain-containing protein